jgi:hypothetical protein
LDEAISSFQHLIRIQSPVDPMRDDALPRLEDELLVVQEDVDLVLLERDEIVPRGVVYES